MNTAAFDIKAISPLDELIAYEALWDQAGASVKTISDKFKNHYLINPSELIKYESISLEKYNLYREEVYKIIKSKIFETCFLGEKDFPNKLNDATHLAPFLYYKGKWDLVYANSISVVGTRNPTPEGIIRTRNLVKKLVKDNYVIMSGLAKGIDTVAHTTAIEELGSTIAVIGTPITDVYPKENKELQNLIAKEHLLISQVPFLRYYKQDYIKNKIFFPERNKVMSALSMATVIVEAGETSGSLIQAREALKQKRKLFILDNCFKNNEISWPAKFEAQGAIRVREYGDIIKALSHE